MVLDLKTIKKPGWYKKLQQQQQNDFFYFHFQLFLTWNNAPPQSSTPTSLPLFVHFVTTKGQDFWRFCKKTNNSSF